MLDVHPPHQPTHTWRDFFIHIATIVVGLLIAVGLEQAVEYFHHWHELTKMREELRAEIVDNRRVTTLQLQHIHEIQAELKSDMALLLAHRDTGKPLNGALHFDWAFRRTHKAAWEANKQSGTLSLMPHEELYHYDYAFTVTENVMDSAEKWQLALENAKAIAERSPQGALSPQDTNELITAISDSQGKLARTERVISFVYEVLNSHEYD